MLETSFAGLWSQQQTCSYAGTWLTPVPANPDELAVQMQCKAHWLTILVPVGSRPLTLANTRHFSASSPDAIAATVSALPRSGPAVSARQLEKSLFLFQITSFLKENKHSNLPLINMKIAQSPNKF